jgi:hypothetical protein
MTTNLEITLEGHFCNSWPMLEIMHDSQHIFDGYIESKQILNFDLVCGSAKSTLRLRHKGKRFGEYDIWDTDPSGLDRYIEISDMKFDGVSIGQEVLSKLWFTTEWSETQKKTLSDEFVQTYSRFLCHGKMNFNGVIELDFELPIYNWLIFNKYKTDRVEAKSYFSQYQENWHYEQDIQLIKEIKELMKFD